MKTHLFITTFLSIVNLSLLIIVMNQWLFQHFEVVAIHCDIQLFTSWPDITYHYPKYLHSQLFDKSTTQHLYPQSLTLER